MKLSLIHVLVAGALTAGSLGQALAQQGATGAGASFPAPPVFQVGGRLQQGYRRKDQLPVGRLQRRHQAD